MTDLCHNCGDCHLGSHPTPCLKALNECIICKNYGHTYNFCPLGVALFDQNYQYWMLCHNCDRWHLPRPCDRELVTCHNCLYIGHLPSFCPIFPDARLRPLGDSTVSTGMQLATSIEQIHPDLLLQIQTQAVSGMHPSRPLATEPEIQPQRDRLSVAQYQSTPIPSLSTTRHNGASSFIESTLQNESGHPFDQQHQQQHCLPMLPRNFPTPVPSSAFKATAVIAGDDPFVDTYEGYQMQKPHDPNATESPEEASVGLGAPDTGTKPKTGRLFRTQATTCTACKKANKRCKHMSDGITSSKSTAPENEESRLSQPNTKRLKLTVGSNAPCDKFKQTVTENADPTRKSETSIAVGQQMDTQGPPYVHQGFLPDVSIHTDAATATQLRGVIHGMHEPREAQPQNLPSFGEVMEGNSASNYIADNYLPHSDHTNFFADGSGTIQQLSSAVPAGPRTIGDPAFKAAQAESRRRSDVFSFGDSGRTSKPPGRQQSVGVLPTTESPCGQIQCERPSPMGMKASSLAPDETVPADETAPATKSKKAAPKKVAPKKKGGGRKQKK